MEIENQSNSVFLNIFTLKPIPAITVYGGFKGQNRSLANCNLGAFKHSLQPFFTNNSPAHDVKKPNVEGKAYN